MAKGVTDTQAQCKSIIEDVRRGVFSPIYLLMGEEPYYVDLVCDEIIAHALDESERDFNQTICYGTDTDVETVITTARRYPMFAQRQLVVVRQAQDLKNFEDLAYYVASPLESTVLVLCVNTATKNPVDKRKSFYKSVSKLGVVLESNAVRDYEIARWIDSFYSSKGLQIDPDAAALLGESAGTELSKIALETEKLLKNLPEGTKRVTVSDIEKNVGVSRQFSLFELTRELSYRNGAKALKVAAYIGASPKFALPMAVSVLFNHFYRILKYDALLRTTQYPSTDKKAAVLGVNPYFFKEYDAAVQNYPQTKCMKVIAFLRDFDFKGKGGNVGEATPAELLVELVAKILTV